MRTWRVVALLYLVGIGLILVGVLTSHSQSPQTLPRCPEDTIIVSTWADNGHTLHACITWDDLSEDTQQQIAEETLDYQEGIGQ